MLNYIMDYLEDKNVYAASAAEQVKLESGIKLFLEANGIAVDEKRPFFKNTVNRTLDMVDAADIKNYLINYKLIVDVNLLLCGIKSNKGANEIQKNQMYSLMTQLNECGLGDKYVPASEIKTMI